MLVELVHSLLVRCAPGARALGLAHEHAGMAARHRRVGRAWDAHLAASRAAILAGAGRCARRERALVIGAGSCRDVPVEELAARFGRVVLADVVLGPTVRRWARRYPGRVWAVAWDATGFLSALAPQRKRPAPNAVVRGFAESDPGPPPGGEPDLVVSANCLSQLGLVPAATIAAEDAVQRCAEAAANRHIAWLAGRAGVRVLLADRARLDVAPDGRELARRPVFPALPLRPPDQFWRWRLAPAPELSRDYDRVHEVGAWIDGPR